MSPRPLNTNSEWQLHAACRGMDVDIFFLLDSARGSAKRAQEARARVICTNCPVQAACLNWAVTNNEPFGVWGGKSPEQRALLIPQHAA